MPSSHREPLDPMAALRRFRTLVEQSVDVIMLVGPTGELLYASLAASSVLGYAPGENLGRATFALVHPDDLAQVHALFRDLLTRSTGPTRAEFRVRHKEGSWRYLEATGINRLDDPAVEAIVVTCRDVTDRRQAEEAQRAAYRIAEAVLSTYSLDELFSSIHRILGDLMPVPNLYIALYDAAGDTLTFPYFVDERESAPPPRRLNHGLTEYVLRTGQPELLGPDRQRELEQRGEVDLLGAASLDWLGIPLKSGANTIGVLVIQSYTESIRFGEREKRILQFVSAEVAVAIERRGAEESLRATQSLLQWVLDNAPIVAWAVNKEGILTMARGSASQEASPGSRYVVGQSALEELAEEELARRAGQQEALSRKLIEAQEAERRAVARELHDDFGQVLTALKLNLQRSDRDDAETIALVDGAIARMRELAQDLRPPLLDEFGLEASLGWYVEREAKRAGLDFRLALAPLARRPPIAVETTCFRIAQEALTNVVRHAQARLVEVELSEANGTLLLTVRDDGQGFDVAAARRRAAQGGSQGLLSMQERATLADGDLDIDSTPSRGTAIRARLPLTARGDA